MGKVLITARSVAAFEDGPALLESAGHEVIRCVGERGWSEEEMVQHIAGMDAAIVGLETISAKVIEAGLPSLKIVARNGVGVNNVDVEAAQKAGVAVTLALGGNTISVCELVFGLMISLARSIPAQSFAVRQGRWERTMGHELYGKVLGVMGTGNIGGEVIKRAHSFGMKIVAYDPLPRQELCQEYGVTYLKREQVIAQADFLTLHVPATASTKHMMNKEIFAVMKPTSFLINTARGILVQEDDLYEALQHGVIAGYGTDTLTQEPPQSNHPLFSLSNVIVTPHCGAYTSEAAIECSVIAAQEVIRVLSAQPPLYAVNTTGK